MPYGNSTMPMPNEIDLLEIFEEVDTDGNGEIDANELQDALSKRRWTFNPETIQLMIGMFDRDDVGTVSFEEFGALWKYLEDWNNCFETFDKDDSGCIKKKELSEALTSFGYQLSSKTVASLIRKFDSRGQGTIDFDDFIQCCVSLNSITSVFKKNDPDQDGVIKIKYETFLNMVINMK